MEYYNGILCISGSELIRSETNPTGVMLLNTYMSLKKRHQINVVRRGCNSTPALIEFDSLPVRYREMVEQIRPDPRKEAIYAPFASRIKHSPQVREVFTSYRHDGKKLPSETIDKYCNDAAIFDALQSIITDMIAKRKSCTIRNGKVNNLGVEQMSIWQYALSLVDSARKVFPCNMPKTERTLERKYKKFITEGYYSLIHSGFGNANRLKLDKLGRAVLMSLCKDGNKQRATTIAKISNGWAAERGCETVTPRMVLQFMGDNAIEITMFRDGKAAWDNKFDKIIRRFRPSAPLMLVNADDNDLDLYYTKKYVVDGKTKTDKYYRPKLYVVIDTAYNYILG